MSINVISGFSFFNETNTDVLLEVTSNKILFTKNQERNTIYFYPLDSKDFESQPTIKITASSTGLTSDTLLLMYDKKAMGVKDVVINATNKNGHLKLDIIEPGYCMVNVVQFTNLGAVSGNFYIRKDGESGSSGNCLWYGSNRSVGFGDTVKLEDLANKLTPYQNLYIGCNVDGSDPSEYRIGYHPSGGHCSANLKGTAFKTWFNITDGGQSFLKTRMVMQAELSCKVEKADSDYPNTIVLSTTSLSVNKYYHYDTILYIEDELNLEPLKILLAGQNENYRISNLLPGKYLAHLETNVDGRKVITNSISFEIKEPQNEGTETKAGKYISALTRIKKNSILGNYCTEIADLKFPKDKASFLLEFPVMYGIGLTVDQLIVQGFVEEKTEYLFSVTLKLKTDSFERLACDHYAARIARYLTQGLYSDLHRVCLLFEFMTITADITYDKNTSDPDNAFGCFWNRKCVCDGFSRGFELLAQHAGMRCIKGGTGLISHAWNIVEIENFWYHLDVTWAVKQTILSSRLKDFLKSDAVYNKSHSKDGKINPWNCSSYEFPKCTNTKYDNSNNIPYQKIINELYPKGIMSFVYVENKEVKINAPFKVSAGSIINKSDNSDAYTATYIIEILKDGTPVQAIETKMFKTVSITVSKQGTYIARAYKKGVDITKQNVDTYTFTVVSNLTPHAVEADYDSAFTEVIDFVDVSE